jgi:hypothetical protein
VKLRYNCYRRKGKERRERCQIFDKLEAGNKLEISWKLKICDKIFTPLKENFSLKKSHKNKRELFKIPFHLIHE